MAGVNPFSRPRPDRQPAHNHPDRWPDERAVEGCAGCLPCGVGWPHPVDAFGRLWCELRAGHRAEQHRRGEYSWPPLPCGVVAPGDGHQSEPIRCDRSADHDGEHAKGMRRWLPGRCASQTLTSVTGSFEGGPWLWDDAEVARCDLAPHDGAHLAWLVAGEHAGAVWTWPAGLGLERCLMSIAVGPEVDRPAEAHQCQLTSPHVGVRHYVDLGEDGQVSWPQAAASGLLRDFRQGPTELTATSKVTVDPRPPACGWQAVVDDAPCARRRGHIQDHRVRSPYGDGRWTTYRLDQPGLHEPGVALSSGRGGGWASTDRCGCGLYGDHVCDRGPAVPEVCGDRLEPEGYACAEPARHVGRLHRAENGVTWCDPDSAGRRWVRNEDGDRLCRTSVTWRWLIESAGTSELVCGLAIDHLGDVSHYDTRRGQHFEAALRPAGMVDEERRLTPPARWWGLSDDAYETHVHDEAEVAGHPEAAGPCWRPRGGTTWWTEVVVEGLSVPSPCWWSHGDEPGTGDPHAAVERDAARWRALSEHWRATGDHPGQVSRRFVELLGEDPDPGEFVRRFRDLMDSSSSAADEASTQPGEPAWSVDDATYEHQWLNGTSSRCRRAWTGKWWRVAETDTAGKGQQVEPPFLCPFDHPLAPVDPTPSVLDLINAAPDLKSPRGGIQYGAKPTAPGAATAVEAGGVVLTVDQGRLTDAQAAAIEDALNGLPAEPAPDAGPDAGRYGAKLFIHGHTLVDGDAEPIGMVISRDWGRIIAGYARDAMVLRALADGAPRSLDDAAGAAVEAETIGRLGYEHVAALIAEYGS